ncbi:HisA/HisF-related TIM barrel protein [Methanobrevibacter arboriphilus]|uniref:HisA/HisF-related TIM barrel protein n=1 Tax=Methanobrevibacter arboriphilus TaxID=39441 RepID=UPI0021E62F68|nr:HisA/HisF-related TIM barrel protein [Methanobrevibacter arboriphilus]
MIFFLEFANKLIVASETLESIEELYKVFDKYPKERVVVSVDIKNGELLSKNFEVSLNDFKKRFD